MPNVRIRTPAKIPRRIASIQGSLARSNIETVEISSGRCACGAALLPERSTAANISSDDGPPFATYSMMVSSSGHPRASAVHFLHNATSKSTFRSPISPARSQTPSTHSYIARFNKLSSKAASSLSAQSASRAISPKASTSARALGSESSRLFSSSALPRQAMHADIETHRDYEAPLLARQLSRDRHLAVEEASYRSVEKGKGRMAESDCDADLSVDAGVTLSEKSSPSAKRRHGIVQHGRHLRRLIKKLADLVPEKQSTGKLAKARAVYYNLPTDFWELTFTDARARQMANYILHELVSLHLPYSLSDKIENLLARFESSASMQDAFIGPYNMLVKSYAQQINVEGALQTLERMKELGNRVSNLLPNERTYNHIITMYAHRREPEAARAAFEEMLAMGIEPSQASFTSLMNAHVEAGQWEQAISIFEHLDSHPNDHPLKPDASTCTTLIKCYTLMGASTADVLSVYAGMVRRNLKPTPRTFVLLLQSACDGGMMDFAEEVFAKMDNMPSSQTYSRKADVEEGGLANQFSFTVMIRGFVRAGRQEDAKQYYEEMTKRGIEPSSATWSTLVGAYADARVNDPRAERIIQNLLSEFLRTYVEDTPQAADSPAEQQTSAVQTLRLQRYKKDKAVARATALHSVYGPVISAYGKVAGAMEENGILSAPGNDATTLTEAGQQNFDDAQQAALRVLDKFLEMQELPGAKPSIHIYTTLLDAYRRANDLDRVQEIWSALFTLAISSSKDALPIRAAQESQSQNFGEAAALLPPSQRNLLCLPLSIYIEALSSNHMHNEVVDVWLRVQEAGFGFDAGNWNHLVVALLRAGELDRAFWTAEKILLEPQTQVLRDSIPATVTDAKAEGYPSTQPEAQARVVPAEDSENGSEDEVQARRARVEPPIRPPNRAHEYRVEDKRQSEAADTVLRLPDAADKSIEAPRPKPPAEQPGSAGDEASESGSRELEREQHERAAPREKLSLEAPSASTESLTGAFAAISARRRKYVWTVYSATLRNMEDSIIRLQRLAEEDERLGAETANSRAERHRTAAREQLHKLELAYPRAWAAIEDFRRRTNRTISRYRK